MKGSSRRVLGIGVALIAVGAVGYQARTRVALDARAEAGTQAQEQVPLYANLGSFERAVTSANADAQRYFDQGMRLTYAFNHAEAIRAFEEATRRDPKCAMCFWGIAYALGPNINAPMDPAAVAPAYRAAQEALRLAPNASPVERALIEALAGRYTDPAPADRAALDRAYAAAMGQVRSRFPEDPDVLTLHAEAVLDLRPWDYWTREGAPREGIAQVVADLEKVLSADPDHPGACHYYIHAVEAVQPMKAVACAERLAALMPGAGHLVHMPAHIYIRTGRWADAITANEHAVHTDETYIRDQGPTGVYPVAYYPHNYHFLSFAATMAGRTEQAIAAARGLVKQVPVEVARQVPAVEPLLPFAHLTLVTFGRWDDVLAEPVPPADLRFATAMTQYARGTAHAAKENAEEAGLALDTVRAIAAATTDPLASAVLQIAQHALAGEIAQRGGDLKGAEAHFREAVAVEDELLYMEPPHWYYPVRHSLGAVLLQQGRANDAEAVFRRDLERFPENTWALHGLQAALRAQNRPADAEALQASIARLGGDVRLTTSRL
jgi:tetratricopeptide (TPR) repeat protein